MLSLKYKRKKCLMASGFLLAMVWFAVLSANAMSGFSDIQSGALELPQTHVMQASFEIPPEHWSYKLMERLMPIANINSKAEGISLDGVHPLNRTGMAVLIADFAEISKKEEIENQLSERDKAQFEILQE